MFKNLSKQNISKINKMINIKNSHCKSNAKIKLNSKINNSFISFGMHKNEN